MDSPSTQAKIDDMTSSKLSASRRRLTFISHASEDKPFFRELLIAIEKQVKAAQFTDDDMVVGTSADDEMITRAEDGDQGIVVISRHFLTEERPMKELNLFLEHGVKIFPLYYGLSPDDLLGIIASYDGRVLIEL